MKNLSTTFDSRVRAINFKKSSAARRRYEFGLLKCCHEHLRHTRQRIPTWLQVPVAFGPKKVKNERQRRRSKRHQKP